MAENNQDQLYNKIFQGVCFFLFGVDAFKKNQVRLKLLEGGGVEVSQCGPNCTHVIVDKVVYDDPICAAARRDAKVLVTSLWVEHSCDAGMLVDVTPIIYRPVRDLNGIPGAKLFVICLTGYQRQDREDIMTMVALMGATFSKPLVASKITHLVCFKFEGEKYELAKKIGKIKLVNHCWLEDCLRVWEILPEADYNKSSYELEIMEAEAKDSEEEREQVPTEPCSTRKVQSPQNLRIERSPHKPSLVESEILRNSKYSNASMIVLGPDHFHDTPSATKKNVTSCSTWGLEGIQNRYPDLPEALGTHALSEVSGFPLNQHANAITPEKVRNNSASTSRTAEKSPSNLSTISYSRRRARKVGLSLCSAQRKSNPGSTLAENKSAFNATATDEFNLSLPIEEPKKSSTAVVKTPVRQHLEKRTTDELLDKTKIGVSGCSGNSHDKTDKLAEVAQSSRRGVPSEIVSHFSASKATSFIEDKGDLGDPSLGELVKDICNSSPLGNSNSSKEVDSNSTPKQGRKKVLGSSRFGKLSSMNKKGSIHSSISSGRKLEENCDSERVKLLDVSADKTVNASMQTSYIEDPRSETNPKARPLDAETKSPDDEADVFFVASHENEREYMTSDKDETVGGNECMTTDKERGKCAAVCSARVEVNETTKEYTTAKSKDKGRKRHLPTKEHEEVKKDAFNVDTQEKKPKKIKSDGKTEKKRKNPSTTSVRAKGDDQIIGGNEEVKKDAFNVDTQEKKPKKNDGKMEKKRKSPVTTSGRAKGDDQIICGNEIVTKNKESSKNNAVCSARDALKKTSKEKTTDGTMDKPRKLPLSKAKNLQNVKKAVNSRESQENAPRILEKNGVSENKKNKVSDTSGQSLISAQEKSLSSLQVEKENSSIVFADEGDELHTGKVSSNSKKKPLRDLKGTTADQEKEPVWFLLSGHKFQRKEFQKIIRCLRGRVCRDSHNWSYQATHLILPDPIRRTEKFFGAAASGRWILKTDYLTASNEAGKFLDEHPYEWHKNSLTEDGSINLVAPRKWRLIRERTGHGAFYGMCIIVYGECFCPPLDTLKRVVKAGGGTVLATSPPYTRFLNSGVDFAIVSPGMPRVDIWIQEFLRHEIPCVLADYLVEYVCKPGYSLDKHVQYGTNSWAEKSLTNLVSRMDEIVED
ncbi:hypothetical protein Leryth_005566 [Lithospermum erythrorhizon]|nr:hypothetical protein Leryth_005566 [Lithospermum erythrorhizon]